MSGVGKTDIDLSMVNDSAFSKEDITDLNRLAKLTCEYEVTCVSEDNKVDDDLSSYLMRVSEESGRSLEDLLNRQLERVSAMRRIMSRRE